MLSLWDPYNIQDYNLFLVEQLEKKWVPAMSKKSPQKREAKSTTATERELEKLAVEYDRAIKSYESLYRQQQTSYHLLAMESSYEPSGYFPQWNYPNTPFGYDRDQSVGHQAQDDYAQAISEYDANLESLEQAHADFTASLPYIKGLKGQVKDTYIQEWKEYLGGLLENCKELISSLEESIKNLSR
jgi:hypothetical protein